MLEELFKVIVITSLCGSALACILILARPVTKKVFGYSWHYYIWLVVLLTMLLPVRFNISQSDNSNIPLLGKQTVEPVQAEDVFPMDIVPQIIQTIPQATALQQGAEFIKRILHNRMTGIIFLWIAGAFLLLCINLIGYIRLLIKLRGNATVISCPEIKAYTDKKVTVRRWENISSPFMVGLFKPTLVLPTRKLDKEQLNNILYHEMTHFKRHDILYKWVTVIVRCIHWFNPIVWYVAKQISLECEISCDLSVVERMDKEEEISYINTILTLLSRGKSKSIPLTTGMTGSKKILKRRFIMIKNKRNISKLASVISMIAAVGMLFITVFASGVLADLTTDDYTVEIRNFEGEKIELINKPFIENSSVYVPLREMFEKAGFDDSNSRIKWENGKIDAALVQSNGNAGFYRMEIGNSYLELKHIDASELYSATIDSAREISMGLKMENVPLIKESVTYVTIKDMDYMLYAFLDMRTAERNLYELSYTVYDKKGEIMALTSAPKENPDEFVPADSSEYLQEPDIFKYDSQFLKTHINDALVEIGVTTPYEYSVVNHVYNDENNKVSFYVQIKQENSDSFDYLTIVFSKGLNDWMTDEYYLEK